MFRLEPLNRAHAHAQHGSHTVTFYEEGPKFSGAVLDHVAEGLGNREGILLLITQQHWMTLRTELAQAEANVEEALEAGRLVVLEATAALAALRSDGVVSEQRFRELVEPAWRRVSADGTRRVRAVGELVDILWQEGSREESIRLERIWERFLAPRDIRLLCAYCIRVLDDASPMVEEVVGLHEGLVHAPDRVNLDLAIAAAFDEVVGVEQAGRLRPLVAMDLGFPQQLGMGERTLFWVRRHLPHHSATIMERARVRFIEQTAQG